MIKVNLVGHPEAPLILIRLSRLDGCRPPVSQGFPVDPILLLFNETYFSLWELAERFCASFEIYSLRTCICSLIAMLAENTSSTDQLNQKPSVAFISTHRMQGVNSVTYSRRRLFFILSLYPRHSRSDRLAFNRRSFVPCQAYCHC